MIKKTFRYFEDGLFLIIISPILFICRIHPKRKEILEERRHWIVVLFPGRENKKSSIIELFGLKEYRTLLYYRLGGISRLFRWYLPDDRYSIALNCNNIGNNFILHHGHGTRIGAVQIGENVEIWHNVTIGTDISHSGHRPTIGNNVKIYTGAIIFGNIHIGDHAIIAAGSIVNKSVPAYTTVAGNPAKIIKTHSEKYDQHIIHQP